MRINVMPQQLLRQRIHDLIRRVLPPGQGRRGAALEQYRREQCAIAATRHSLASINLLGKLVSTFHILAWLANTINEQRQPMMLYWTS